MFACVNLNLCEPVLHMYVAGLPPLPGADIAIPVQGLAQAVRSLAAPEGHMFTPLRAWAQEGVPGFACLPADI